MNYKLQTHNYSKRGFTLVELLVVIAIVGILSTILMVSFNGIRERSRDSRRKADLLEIKTALELYRSDKGVYPDATQFPSTCGKGVNFTDGTTIYMKDVPCDPKNPAANTKYTYTPVAGSANSRYDLKACLENVRDQDPGVNSSDTTCTAPLKTFVVSNP